MLRVVLQYTDCLQEGKTVFGTLAAHNVEIIKTTCLPFSICPRIIIRIEDINKLNECLYDLNKNSIYEVRIVKAKKENLLIRFLFGN